MARTLSLRRLIQHQERGTKDHISQQAALRCLEQGS